MADRMARVLMLAMFALGLALAMGCSGTPKVMPQDMFWANLGNLCGKAYPGRVVTDSTNSATFRDRPLTLRVTECGDDSITMPLLVGGQTWVTMVVTRENGQLTLTHLHEPGQEGTSPPSGYGGTTQGTGTEFVQDFYASEFTATLDEGAEDTVWTLELRPGAVMQYGLRRQGSDRRFRAAFDLTRGRPAPTVLPAGEDS